MTAALFTLTVLSLVTAAAAQTPRTAAGEPVARGRRSFTSDVRYLVTRTGY
jgi:hypothetical protein